MDKHKWQILIRLLLPTLYANQDRLFNEAIDGKHGATTIVRGSGVQSSPNVGKKYRAQMELKKKGK